MDDRISNKLGKQLDNRLAFKSGMLYLIAEFFTRGISFLATPIFTRLLPTAVFADVKIYESWVYLIAPIVSLSLYQSLSRAKFDFEENYDKYLSSMLSLMAIITLCVFMVFLPLIDVLEHFFCFSGPLLLMMLLYCFAYNGIQCIQLHDRQLMHYKRNIVLTILSVLPAILIALIFVVKYSGIVTNEQLLSIRIVSFFLPTTLVGFIAISFAMAKGRSIINLKHWEYGIIYSSPMMLSAVAAQVYFHSANLIVKNFYGLEVAAIIALAMTVGYIMDILIHAIDNAWRPWLFEQLNAGKFKEIQKTWRFLFLCVTLIVWCMVMVAPELVMFLGGIKYVNSVWFIYPILCGSLANFLLIEYTAIEQYYKKTRFSGYASIISVVIALAINFVFIRLFGYKVAAYTTSAAYLISCLVHYLFVRRFEKNNVLRTGNSFLIIFIAFIVCTLSSMLFGVALWLRFLAIIVVLVVVIISARKQLIALLQLFGRLKNSEGKVI